MKKLFEEADLNFLDKFLISIASKENKENYLKEKNRKALEDQDRANEVQREYQRIKTVPNTREQDNESQREYQRMKIDPNTETKNNTNIDPKYALGAAGLAAAGGLGYLAYKKMKSKKKVA
jgi:hypothetical protein